MEDNNRTLLLVVVLSATILFGWQYFVAGPAMKTEEAKQARIAHQEKEPAAKPGLPGATQPNGHLTIAEAKKAGGERILIDTPTIDGSLLLKGARFDDLR